LLILALALFAGAPLPVGAQELTLSAAISMKDAVQDLGRLFERTRPGVFLRFNFASSGELQKQIEAGAPVDVFVSAADRQMDDLEHQGLILPGSRCTFARNALLVIVPRDSRLAVTGPADLLQPHVQRVAIGNPKTVPAGRYAEESLRALGLWDSLRAKLVFAENVRQVLEYVARGEVDAGFVYATDPATRKGLVKQAFRPPQSSYTPVAYPVAVVASSQQADLGRAFIELLVSRQGQDALARRGFLPPTESR
jgi:molybdate transport system substrate-binding protein